MLLRMQRLIALVLLPASALAAPPSLEEVRARHLPSEAVLLDRHGAPLAELRVDRSARRLDWANLTDTSPALQEAVVAAEDKRFYSHGGVDWRALFSAAWDNLRRERARGASTISMQLAKNLYLKRHKTLSRKLQEAFLTMYLEQELTKEQIMELYLNVVEFAPDVYGIGPAASHYFNSSPSRLSLGQSMYLASILPSPKVQHFGAGGAVSPGWMRYLHTLMRHAHKRHRITDEELEEGLAETVVFGSPSPRRAPSGDVSDPGVEDLQPWEEDPGGWVAP